MRELQKNNIFGSAYVGLGVYKLQLDELANELLSSAKGSTIGSTAKTTEDTLSMDLFKGIDYFK